MPDPINYHEFVDTELKKLGLRIELITEDIMKRDIRKFSEFINAAFAEYYEVYKWRKHADDDYLLNPLIDKFKFSFCIRDSDDNLVLVDFASVVDNRINHNFVFTAKKHRGRNLAKYQFIKLCQTALDNGYREQVRYFSKKNNGSIILHLKMGFEISHIKDDGLLVATADNARIIENTYNALLTANANKKQA
jgi:GNAT superfamily N-acetyltransferase